MDQKNMGNRFKSTGILFILGFIGVLSTLTMEINLPAEAQKELEAALPPELIKYLLLINPTIFLVFALAVGTFMAPQTTLRSPLIDSLFSKDNRPQLKPILVYGAVGGVLSGILLVSIAALFESLLPLEFQELSKQVQPGLMARFLYGGLTEEILMRFGMMTLFVFIAVKVFGEKASASYWIGIVFSSILFAVGHFPVVFQTLETPSNLLLLYILIGNSVGGFIFGWLYWKKGLEASMIAHMFAHVVMVLSAQLFS